MLTMQDVANITVAGSERTGTLLCGVPQHEAQHSRHSMDNYPEINLSCENFNTSASAAFSRHCDSFRSVLVVPVNEGVLKRITRTFFESGIVEAINVARSPETAAASPWISSIATCTYQAIELVDRVKKKIFPHLREQGVASIATYSETRDWMRSCIRCIVWHPNCFKIAVAGSDDVIRIYTDEPAMVPVLKSSNQRWISSMAWRPYAAAELAVGCQTGVCLWTMDNNMHMTRTTSQSVFLKHPKNCPITSVQWNSDGTLLATSSIGDPDVLIWNVDKLQNTRLKRLGAPCSILKWSLDGASLFSATIGNVFRVWSTERNWTAERWTIKAGTVRSACWSPCGNFLLFITSEDPFLYRLQFHDEHYFATDSVPKQALPVADLSKCTIGHREVGGQPQAVAWDPDGAYLAITFKDTPCIVVFSTSVLKFNMTISPLSFITGNGVEYPSYMCFQSKNRKNSDTVLTIGWSSGRIQYFPLVNM